MADMGKRVGVAVDYSQCSKKALRWAIDNLLKKGDHLILITVRGEHNYESAGEMQLWETTGSPLIPYNDFSNPNTMKKYKVVPDEETIKLVDNAAKEKEARPNFSYITPLLKIFWGDPREKLCEAVNNIPLTCLVIGNRGLGPLKRAILGSVSNHVVNNATCPHAHCVMTFDLIYEPMMPEEVKYVVNNSMLGDRAGEIYQFGGSELYATKTGAAQEAVENTARRVSKALTEQEARQILGVPNNAAWDEILKKYDVLFERNAKQGSFYLQSKVHRAKECLEGLYQNKG
ncbi:hypothetical protein KSS87_011708 [Heliosperma pusillum]|nr:hypothetical protein KSS87_011708 [Heliosperma pusillum]